MIVMSGYFGIYPSTTGWRWRLVANNGFIIATAGEAYRNYADAENGIDVVKTAGRQDWNVYDDVPRAGAFCVYRDTVGQYRWNLYATNGQIVAVSSESYVARSGAHESVRLTKSAWWWPTLKVAA
jgi:uncharacterized protein YegP (UPF0339 family)